MNARLATVFGGNGFLGRYIVQHLARKGWRVRVACRDTEAAAFLKPLGDPGQIVAIKANITKATEVARAIEGAHRVVNCVGILTPSRRNSFTAIHEHGAANIAKAAGAAGVEALVHISALGADEQATSRYARSKAAGEKAVLQAFPKATVLRPSLIIGAEDRFFNPFAALARWSPFVPSFGYPLSPKFQPVYVGDVANAVMRAFAHHDTEGQIYDITGPHVYDFRQLMELMLRVIERERMIVPWPLAMVSAVAVFAEFFPGKPLTRDQVRMLRHDNIATGENKGLAELGLSAHNIETILPSYLEVYKPPSRRRSRLGKI